MCRGAFAIADALVEHAEAVVGLCDVLVDATRPGEQLPRPREVTAFQLYQAEVDERLDEMRVVLEGESETCVGGLEVTPGQVPDALVVQRDGFGG